MTGPDVAKTFPSCSTCDADAIAVDEPPANTGRTPEAACARHLRPKPPAGWRRIKLTETRTARSER